MVNITENKIKNSKMKTAVEVDKPLQVDGGIKNECKFIR